MSYFCIPRSTSFFQKDGTSLPRHIATYLEASESTDQHLQRCVHGTTRLSLCPLCVLCASVVTVLAALV